MTAPRSDSAEFSQHLGRVDRALVDAGGQRRKLLARDPRHFVRNGRRGLIQNVGP
ncbi:hypothetical protein ABIF81_001419 [Bradyrhizobium daqingense]